MLALISPVHNPVFVGVPGKSNPAKMGAGQMKGAFIERTIGADREASKVAGCTGWPVAEVR